MVVLLAGIGCMAGGGLLGWHQTQGAGKKPELVQLAEKFDAIIHAVAAADLYFMEREKTSASDGDHYDDLRGLLAEISRVL